VILNYRLPPRNRSSPIL